MSGTQVSAGVALMRKVLPDLANVQIIGAGPDGEHLVKMGADEAFAHILADIGGIAARAASGGSISGGLDQEGEAGADHA